MAKKTKVKTNVFNLYNLEASIKQLKLYEEKIEDKVDIFAERMAQYGVEIAKSHILKFNATFTLELLNNVHYEHRWHGIYFIVSDTAHSAFVEFGTGQIGEEAPYPYPFPDEVVWKYNDYEGESTHIFEIEDGQYGWFYPTLNGEWRFTQGMPSRPFMAETASELETIVRKVVREVFNAR